jgi:hypothetical protein
VPYDKCGWREEVSLTWPSEYIEQAIDLAEPRQLSIILVHSHPNGTPQFSPVDDRSDREIVPSIFQGCGSLHGSAVMLPRGVIFARMYTPDMQVAPVDLVSVVGEELDFWWAQHGHRPATRPMAFTSCAISGYRQAHSSQSIFQERANGPRTQVPCTNDTLIH